MIDNKRVSKQRYVNDTINSLFATKYSKDRTLAYKGKTRKIVLNPNNVDVTQILYQNEILWLH